ncbi:hypothetical protein MKW98_015936, partial [Papaver atlanticum]
MREEKEGSKKGKRSLIKSSRKCLRDSCRRGKLKKTTIGVDSIVETRSCVLRSGVHSVAHRHRHLSRIHQQLPFPC